MRPDRHMSGAQMAIWTTLGVGTGLVAGLALSEWLGDVNRRRLRNAARRLQEPRPAPRLTAAAGVRAARAALHADSRLCDLPLEAIAVARGTVELRGWVPTRALRAHAARVTRAVAGIDSVIDSIRVRGEDDLPEPDPDLTDQSA